ncbi:phenylalanine 4-monooxygenase [Legionella hackeliae]|uniref:Phenylalanine-4-hydroxylase n=1 Tax=Legionella hackeliae TaxID=449 RepID=A0A0A8USZ5_LEGHA|nr:phenylalanine 4-monooxygenase [Legionella hackeliae]KTD10410.1 phenylalanine-4-hydroxylase [Legionella hackeliae]CEK09909.1 Phenylalanine-4-hydroxylase [Legionella hackeliae]STX49821.1 phenylalanine-4-hydroxylase [Legionella hackeliae]
MEFVSRYVSHQPDAKGMVNYSSEEHRIWQLLYERQMKIIPNRACNEFIQGVESLGLSSECIPQLPEVSGRLKSLTGWEVAPVAALISAREFFQLLAERRFPAATFIRCEEEIDYVQEPDIFHEIFGHCPMLTDPVYADFVCNYARKVLNLTEDKWPLLQRLFWFTVEFGLIKTSEGLRAYGGGILSSISETPYSVESDIPMRVLFDPVVAFRMPYRIDMLQPVYFVIDNYQMLYNFVEADIMKFLERAKELGEYPPFFAVDENNPSIHILAC